MTRFTTPRELAFDDRGPVFVPCTREVSIGDGVVYRPIRSWHSGTYAGEHIASVGGDGSGCVTRTQHRGYTTDACSPPSTVIHRLYWNTARPDDTISAFLSYPNGMGCVDEYFWEAFIGDDVERWTGDSAETDMEKALLVALGDSARGTVAAEETQKARDERPAKMEKIKRRVRKSAAKLRAGVPPEEALKSFVEDDAADDDPFTLN